MHNSNRMRAKIFLDNLEDQNGSNFVQNLLQYRVKLMIFILIKGWRAKFKASAGHICPTGRKLCMPDLNNNIIYILHILQRNEYKVSLTFFIDMHFICRLPRTTLSIWPFPNWRISRGSWKSLEESGSWETNLLLSTFWPTNSSTSQGSFSLESWFVLRPCIANFFLLRPYQNDYGN